MNLIASSKSYPLIDRRWIRRDSFNPDIVNPKGDYGEYQVIIVPAAINAIVLKRRVGLSESIQDFTHFCPALVFFIQGFDRFCGIGNILPLIIRFNQLQILAHQRPARVADDGLFLDDAQVLQKHIRLHIRGQNAAQHRRAAGRQGATCPPDMEKVKRRQRRACAALPFGLRAHLLAGEVTLDQLLFVCHDVPHFLSFSSSSRTASSSFCCPASISRRPDFAHSMPRWPYTGMLTLFTQ